VSRTLGLAALLLLAILSIVGVVGVTRPVRVESATNAAAPQRTAAAPPLDSDAGSLDSLLDGLHVEHRMTHGR
jgi:hypothetical protein